MSVFCRVRTALRLVVRDFFRYQGLIQASSLSFFALLSFIPLIFMVLAVAGLLWGDRSEVSRFIEEQAAHLSPWSATDVHTVFARILEKASGLGWLSLILILWTSGLFFATLQQTLRLPWAREKRDETGIWRFLMPWLLGPALGFALTLVMLANHLVGYVPWELIPLEINTFAWSVLAMAMIVTLLYSILLPFRSHVGVTLVAALGIALASQGITSLFSNVITELPNYSKVYGSLAGIVLFLLWIEYNMALILIGGHLIRAWPDVASAPRCPATDPSTSRPNGQVDGR